MSFRASVIADSVSPGGKRLTTCESTYPRIIHSEMMTHRMFARNSASTRAIPLATQLQNLLDNPFIPEKFGVNQPGMQAFGHLVGEPHRKAVNTWLRGRDRAVTTVIELILGDQLAGDVLKYKPGKEFADADTILSHFAELKQLFPKSTDNFDPATTELLNVHKQLAGRGLEAYMWHTIVLSATEFDNFFALRDHRDAQGEIATIARLMKGAIVASTPTSLGEGEWHLPYVEKGEFDAIDNAIKASVARTAATSYNRQHNKNPEREMERYGALRSGGHMSPFEHQATPFTKDERQLRLTLQQDITDVVGFDSLAIDDLTTAQLTEQLEFSGSFRGWTSHRKQIANEDNFSKLLVA